MLRRHERFHADASAATRRLPDLLMPLRHDAAADAMMPLLRRHYAAAAYTLCCRLPRLLFLL